MKVNELTCEILERNGFVYSQETESLTITHKLEYHQETVRIRACFDYFKDKWMIFALSFLGYARTVQDMNKLLKRNLIKTEDSR
jgi:hypothetical protein